MRTPWSTIAVVGVLALAGCRSHGRVKEPFDWLTAPTYKESREVNVAADESAIAVRMSPPHPCWIVYDGDLSETEYMAGARGQIAFASTGNEAVWIGYESTQIVTPHDMDHAHDIDTPDGLDGRGIVLADPRANRWIVIDQRTPDQVSVVDREAGRVTHRWTYAFGRRNAAAIDAESNLLVVAEKDSIALFALDSPEPVHQLALPGARLGHDAGASGGRVWISTNDRSGQVLEYDVASRSIVGRFGIGMAGRMLLAVSPSRTHLAVLVRHYVADEPDPCRIVIYRIQPGALTPIRTLDTHLPGTAHDLALMSRSQILLIACGRAGTIAWRYGEPD